MSYVFKMSSDVNSGRPTPSAQHVSEGAFPTICISFANYVYGGLKLSSYSTPSFFFGGGGKCQSVPRQSN